MNASPIKVRLHEAPKTLPSGKRAVYYVLRWVDSKGRTREKSVGRARKAGGSVTRAAAESARASLEDDLRRRARPP